VEKSPRTSLNEGLMISLREVGFFDSGSADIRPSSRSAFDRLAAVLQSADTDLRVEGHTDNVPIRNARFASNWDLSTARATATVRLLMSKYNFAPERLAASGYAPDIARSPATTLPIGARRTGGWISWFRESRGQHSGIGERQAFCFS